MEGRRDVSLRGSKIVVIGGASGMGLATARAAVSEGASVVIAGRTMKKLEVAVDEIGGGAEPFAVDLVDEGSVAQLFERVGELDHLAVTGASGSTGAFLSQPMSEAKAFMDSKFWGAFRAARYAAPRIRAGGSITFNSGNYAIKPAAGVAAVTASLAALEMLGKSLALELAPIRVNSVRPGTIDTPLWGSMSEAEREEMFESAAGRAPVGRIGRPEDVARAILFLMDHDYVTGTVLEINGGESLV